MVSCVWLWSLEGLGILGPQRVRGFAKSMTKILGLDFEILYIYKKGYGPRFGCDGVSYNLHSIKNIEFKYISLFATFVDILCFDHNNQLNKSTLYLWSFENNFVFL